jgi:23S rRNA (guanosine2251-2'-O)-methyltransferase
MQKHFNKTWIYGKHAVLAALRNKRRQLYQLLGTKDALLAINDTLQITQVKVDIVDSKYLDKILGSQVLHQNLALEAAPLKELSLEDILEDAAQNSVLVILDQLTDPHNVGAILRSSAAFAASAVIMTKHNSPKDSAVIAKVAAGAMEITPLIKVTNLAQSIKIIKDQGYWVIGLDGYAKECLHQVKLQGKIALVLGSEGLGLRRLTIENCDILAKLPIDGMMESLNVSNAAAIALYEYYLQNIPFSKT